MSEISIASSMCTKGSGWSFSTREIRASPPSGSISPLCQLRKISSGWPTQRGDRKCELRKKLSHPSLRILAAGSAAAPPERKDPSPS
mmetsp:Transcript_60981/g.74745  ORF Transcript_60981/g.74745 Transcript_60981/m.74745 type:complete len:87 (-) Transcript_60981:211-471(-)